eukprot:scaffold41479_cov58-Phaeocystis_antarctica.AAC.5
MLTTARPVHRLGVMSGTIAKRGGVAAPTPSPESHRAASSVGRFGEKATLTVASAARPVARRSTTTRPRWSDATPLTTPPTSIPRKTAEATADCW